MTCENLDSDLPSKPMTRQEFVSLLASKLDNCPVLKSLAIAQACLESGFGKHSFYNNIYGIKCHDTNAYAGCRLGKTSEVIDGSYHHGLKLAFQTYDSIDDSIVDYCNLMKYDRYTRVRDADNYIDATAMIKACGYATSLTYRNSLRRVIEQNDLTKYDKEGTMDADTQLTTNFKYGEFYSNSTSGKKIEPPEELYDNVLLVAQELQKVRDATGRPIRITSGWRSVEWNKVIGGAKFSRHLLGLAADIKVYIPQKELLIYLGRHTCFNGFGISNSFTHVDVRSIITTWYY